MIRILSPYRDIQDDPPRGYCRICQAELYEYDDEAYCEVHKLAELGGHND